jgi:hypothetical protein
MTGRMTPGRYEEDERADLDVIDAAIKGGPEPGDENGHVSLSETVDGALKELSLTGRPSGGHS